MADVSRNQILRFDSFDVDLHLMINGRYENVLTLPPPPTHVLGGSIIVKMKAYHYVIIRWEQMGAFEIGARAPPPPPPPDGY